MRQNGFYRHARATDRDAARVRAEHEQAQRDAMRARETESRRVEAERVPLTRDDFNGKQYARIGSFWFRIISVNQITVTVDYSDFLVPVVFRPERFPFHQIREVR
ncbi:MAG: hypothetical protein ACJLS2_02350 [Microcella pacifica]